MKFKLAVLMLAMLMGHSLTTGAQSQQIEWMDPMWVEGAKLPIADAVVIAIDVSGSIQETKRLPHEKTLAIGILNVLLMQNSKNPIVAVYTFNDAVEPVIQPTRLSELDLGQAISAINSIQDAKRLTWLSGAIEEACKVTQPASPNGTLVLLTDGRPTTPSRHGLKNISKAMDAAIAAAQRFREECSTLAVVAVEASGEDETFLRQIASPGAFLSYAKPTLTVDKLQESRIKITDKLDPLLADLLLLLAQPTEYVKARLTLLQGLIALPEDADLDKDFLVDVLIGVKKNSLDADDLEGLIRGDLFLDHVRSCEGSEGPPTYNEVSVYTGQVRVIPNVSIEKQPLLTLAANRNVLAIDPSFINKPELDVSVFRTGLTKQLGWTWTGINAAALWPLGIQGQDVIVGIVDGGIDWDHEGFTNPGTRLISQWDQLSRRKNTPAWLNVALAAGVWCTTGDDHGTHVAGIAAGDETATGGRFPGVAPRADIVDVRTTFGDRDVIRGVAYVFGVAAAQIPPAPAVVNLSLGSHYGPHDGTGLSEVALAGLTGPGCLIVKSAGNDGNRPIHTDNDTTPIRVGTTGSIVLNTPAGIRQTNIRIWFNSGNNYSSSVKKGNIILAAAAPGFRTTSRWRMAGNIVRVVVHNFKVNGLSGDRMISISLEAMRGLLPAGQWVIELSRPAGAGGSGYYDAWIAYPRTVSFAAPTYKESISEPGNSPLIITTGSFDSKSCFRDNQQVCDPGRHSTFSSIGPTRETPATVAAGKPGWLKPDISAPGCTIESAENTPNNPASPYTIMEGTSMAAAHMTGCIALMLQVNQNLTPVQVLGLLPGFVWLVDAFYPAALPDNVWGWGKLCCACRDHDGDGNPDLLHVADGNGNGIPDGLEP